MRATGSPTTNPNAYAAEQFEVWSYLARVEWPELGELAERSNRFPRPARSRRSNHGVL